MKSWMTLCLFAVALSLPAAAAEKAAEKKAAGPKKAEKKAERKKRAKMEKLACRLGTEDEHARIAVMLADGKVDSFAYYSKWKPRTCSMEVKRDDAFSKWQDTGNTTVVTLIEEKGAFLIDNGRGRYHFIFRDIDRMRYCGMEGKVNGTLTIYKGRPQCEVTGVMDRDEPAPVATVGKPAATESEPHVGRPQAIPDLGKAAAEQKEQQKPVEPAPAVAVPPAAAPASAAPAATPAAPAVPPVSEKAVEPAAAPEAAKAVEPAAEATTSPESPGALAAPPAK